MPDIANVSWLGEGLKAVIDFSDVDLPDIVLYADQTLSESGTCIINAKFNWLDTNRNINPLGLMEGASCNLDVHDVLNELNVENPDSPYYGCITPGRKVTIYCGYEDHWEEYGTWTVTGWTNQFSDGAYQLVGIDLSDGVDELGDTSIPESEYSGQTAQDAVDFIFTELGYASGDYITSLVDLSQITYDTLKGPYIRNDFNEICQRALVCIIKNRAGKFVFLPALTPAGGYNTYTLTDYDLGQISTNLAGSLDYAKVKVTFPGDNNLQYENLGSVYNQEIQGAENTILVPISDNKKAFSIENVNVDVDNPSVVEDVEYFLNQNTVKVIIRLADTTQHLVDVSTYGLVKGGQKDRSVTTDIPGSTISTSGSTFEYTSKDSLTEAEALTLANNLRDYIVKLHRQINVKNGILTPYMTVGDVIYIIGTDTVYDGLYKLSSFTVNFGETYSTSMTLLRQEENNE